MRAITAPGGTEEANYRYGVVLAIILALVAFAIVAPGADWSRAVGFGLEMAALVTAVATSREPRATRGRRATVTAAIGAGLVVAIGVGALPTAAAYGLGGLAAALLPVTLTGGVLRLLRNRGVTVQAVAGALSLYLLVGLLFAWLISFVSQVQSGAYFVQQHHVDASNATYYSFTVMTTTGLGDLTAATRVGRMLAVLEMLVGQIYVVVVIGLLVGSFSGRRRAERPSQ